MLIIYDTVSGQKISISGLIFTLTPAEYFVVLYCVLYLFSPYINRFLEGISDRELLRFLIMAFLFFSVWSFVINALAAPTSSKSAAGTYTYIAYVKDNPDIKGEVTVTVKGNNPDPKPDPSPSEEHEPLYTGTWNAPVKSGSWSQDKNGIWHYTASKVFRQTWGYILNPYAKEGQNTADWFWFDIHGNMLTGWQFINGKWYYLNPVKESGNYGACQLGGVTPDGWTVDESGAWIESIPKK